MTTQTRLEIQRCQQQLADPEFSDQAGARQGLEDWFWQSLYEDGLMAEHYTKNTLETTRFCTTCNRNTQWYVWDGRLGRCKEEHHPAKPKKPETEDLQKDLFEK